MREPGFYWAKVEFAVPGDSPAARSSLTWSYVRSVDFQERTEVVEVTEDDNVLTMDGAPGSVVAWGPKLDKPSDELFEVED